MAVVSRLERAPVACVYPLPMRRVDHGEVGALPEQELQHLNNHARALPRTRAYCIDWNVEPEVVA
eukprot:6341587-Alexandrium_andersonii.AAC.1